MPRNNTASAPISAIRTRKLKTSPNASPICAQDLTLRQDTSGDKFRIELDRQDLDNRGIAGRIAVAAGGENQNPVRRGHPHRAALPVLICSSAPVSTTPPKSLCAAKTVTARASPTRRWAPSARLKPPCRDLRNAPTRLESDITDAQKRAKELEAKVGAPFEQEERYHQLTRRQIGD